MKILV
jgi:hypothetical protein